MSIAVTCVCHNTFAADAQGPERTVSCPVCAAEMRLSAGEDGPIAVPVAAENDLSGERVLPEGEIALRIEPCDEIVEVDVQTVDDDADAGPDFYAFLPDRRELFDPAPCLTSAGPGFWATMGRLRFAAPVSCLACGRGNRWALVGQDCDVQICNLTAGARTHRFVEHRAPLTCVALAPNGLTALSADESGALLWWDLTTRRVLHRRDAHSGPVNALAAAPGGEFAATGGADGIIRLWDLAASCRECRLADARWQEQVTALDFSSDGRVLVAGGGAGCVDCWRVEDGVRLHQWFVNDPVASVRCASGRVTAAAEPEENNLVAHPGVFRWRVDSGVPLKRADDWSQPTCVPQCAALDHAGQRLIVAGAQRALPLQEPAVASLINEIGEAFRDFFSFVPVSLATRPRFVLEVRSLATGQRLHAFPPVPGIVKHLAVSPDNTRILAGMTNGEVRVFAMPGG